MYYDINSHEKVLDSIIDLLQRNQFDETFNSDGLEKMCSHLQTIYKNHLITDKFDEALFLNDLICFGNFSSELITVDLQRIHSLTEVFFQLYFFLFIRFFLLFLILRLKMIRLKL